MEEPPSFQTAAQCVACRASFTTFKRRHHCRACGRSFCNEHSANQKALPQYGLYSPVRVCDECFNPPKSAPNGQGEHAAAVSSNTSQLEGLDLGADNYKLSNEDDQKQLPSSVPVDCSCGMPLCICEAPSVSKVVPSTAPTVASQKSREPRKPSTSSPSPFKLSTFASSGNSMPSLFFSSGKTSQGSSHPLSKSYDLSGEVTTVMGRGGLLDWPEGIREAVKNDDVSAVKELLSQGVDVNYVDKQGMSLLHLAAMFNFTEITFILMDSGANLLAKNAQGETALDCAQTTLQHKMRLRIDSTSKK